MRFKQSILLILLTCIASPKSFSKDLMTSNFDDIQQIFLSGNDWIEFPDYYDRDSWDAIPTELRDLIFERGFQATKEPLLIVSGYDYLTFKRGSPYIDEVTYKLHDKKVNLERMILAELITGENKFFARIISSIYDLCSISSWTSPSSDYLQNNKLGIPVSDSYNVDATASEIAATLAWAYYFFHEEFEQWDTQINGWIIRSINEKFLEPCSSRYDYFWMSYETEKAHYQTAQISLNWLISTLILNSSNNDRQMSVNKVFETMDHFMNSYPTDGVCTAGSEGWKYTAGKFFEMLEILDWVSVGEINLYDEQLIKNMGDYANYLYIHNKQNVNFSESETNTYMPAGVMYRFGEKTENEMLMNLAQYITNQSDNAALLDGDLYNCMRNCFAYEDIMASQGREPNFTDKYFEESQVVIARDNIETIDGFFVAIKGGNNEEFLNQNDAGSFIIYYNGKPLFIDPGKTARTSESISDARYSIWTNQSSWHNLPTINGQQQAGGEHYSVIEMTHSDDESTVQVGMQLSTAYDESAEIKNWTRKYIYTRGKSVKITDDFSLFNIKGETFISFITFAKPEVSGSKITLNLDGENFELAYNASTLKPYIESIETENDRYLKKWGKELYRITLSPMRPPRSGSWEYEIVKK